VCLRVYLCFQTGVNFINIYACIFCTKILGAKDYKVVLWVRKFWCQKISYKKRARKRWWNWPQEFLPLKPWRSNINGNNFEYCHDPLSPPSPLLLNVMYFLNHLRPTKIQNHHCRHFHKQKGFILAFLL